MNTISYLKEATVRFLLKDVFVTNEALAEQLQLRAGQGEAIGSPGCLLFDMNGRLAAIRTEPGELVVFLFYQRIMTKIVHQKLGIRVETL